MRRWTEHDSQTLKHFAGRIPAAELARRLGRTETAVRIRAAELKVHLKFPPADEKNRPAHGEASPVEHIGARAAIERAISIYQQLHDHDRSVMLQARKILTQHIYGMVDRGERNEQRLTVGGLAHLKAVERDHAIKSARATPVPTKKRKALPVV